MASVASLRKGELVMVSRGESVAVEAVLLADAADDLVRAEPLGGGEPISIAAHKVSRLQPAAASCVPLGARVPLPSSSADGVVMDVRSGLGEGDAALRFCVQQIGGSTPGDQAQWLTHEQLCTPKPRQNSLADGSGDSFVGVNDQKLTYGAAAVGCNPVPCGDAAPACRIGCNEAWQPEGVEEQESDGEARKPLGAPASVAQSEQPRNLVAQAIIGRRIRAGMPEYLVRWLSHGQPGHEVETWEARAQLGPHANLVDSFELSELVRADVRASSSVAGVSHAGSAGTRGFAAGSAGGQPGAGATLPDLSALEHAASPSHGVSAPLHASGESCCKCARTFPPEGSNGEGELHPDSCGRLFCKQCYASMPRAVGAAPARPTACAELGLELDGRTSAAQSAEPPLALPATEGPLRHAAEEEVQSAAAASAHMHATAVPAAAWPGQPAWAEPGSGPSTSVGGGTGVEGFASRRGSSGCFEDLASVARAGDGSGGMEDAPAHAPLPPASSGASPLPQAFPHSSSLSIAPASRRRVISSNLVHWLTTLQPDEEWPELIRSRRTDSGYKGVTRCQPIGKRGRHKWQAQMCASARVIHLGSFDDPKAAAQAYSLAQHRVRLLSDQELAQLLPPGGSAAARTAELQQQLWQKQLDAQLYQTPGGGFYPSCCATGGYGLHAALPAHPAHPLSGHPSMHALHLQGMQPALGAAGMHLGQLHAQFGAQPNLAGMPHHVAVGYQQHSLGGACAAGPYSWSAYLPADHMQPQACAGQLGFPVRQQTCAYAAQAAGGAAADGVPVLFQPLQPGMPPLAHPAPSQLAQSLSTPYEHTAALHNARIEQLPM